MDDDRVLIFDTTLRDGEQSPGHLAEHDREARDRPPARAARRRRHRGRLPDRLARATSRPCRRSPARSHGPVIAGLARAHAADIERAAEAVRDAERPRIHTFISTSRHPHRAPAAVHARGRARARRAPPSRTRARSSRTSSSRRWTPPAPTSSSPPRWCRSRSTRARRRSTSRTPSATRCPRSTRAFLDRLYEHVPDLQRRRPLRRTATTTSAWRSPTRSPACRRARARSSARSTASASARATRRSRRS